MRQRPNPPASIGFTALRDLSGEEFAQKLTGPPEEVARWLVVAAKYGLVEAQAALGQILLDGRGVERDRHAAAGWFAIASAAGHAPATNMLGRCCEHGWGMAADLGRAAALYRCASDADLDWGHDNLANLLLRGRGVARDRRQALALYRRAAGQGHAKSINMVGRCIEEGWEMPADSVAAIEWYRRAAEGGDFRGQYNLASVLAAQGDIAPAEAWLRRAMETATADFLGIMSARLAGSAEPRLRRVGAMAGALAAAKVPAMAGERMMV
jgi:uncharacterized protein